MPDQSRRVRISLWTAIVTLAAVVVVMLIIGFLMRADLNQARSDLNEARTRLSALEVKTLAEDASKRTAEVATCFATARSRPNLIVILELISGLAVDSTERQIVNGVIEDYRMSAPTLAECRKRAIENGLDPDDFPPVNRGEEGNGR